MDYQGLRFQNTYPPGGSYLRGVQPDSQSGQVVMPSSNCDNALAGNIAAREERIRFLMDHGEPFWLPVSLGLGTTPASGTTFQSVTTSVDFDLLITGGECTIFQSTIDIRDSARQRILTNATAPIGAIFDIQVSGTVSQRRNPWQKPYLLPARSQFALTVTANGTESNGVLTFYCLQPPTYTA